jgi:TetR/AcrR family transcriptional repressor of nem operon
MYGHINLMPKPSNREKILTEGLKVVHAHGFANASVRDIVHAAGVPQGSFTNHFASKEAFGLEVIGLYLDRSRATMAATLLNDSLAPLDRLSAYIDANQARMAQTGMRNGCLFGNFTAEASDHSEAMREKLLDVFAEIRANIATCLRAAAAAGDLPAAADPDDLAAFILTALQGANLLSKAERSPAPIERLRRLLFTKILK